MGPTHGVFQAAMFNCKDSIDKLLEYLDAAVKTRLLRL